MGNMKTKEFTTSMNRKICWEDGFKEGKQQTLKDVLGLIKRLQKNVSKQKNEQAMGWHNGLEELKAQIEKELGEKE